MEYAMAAENIAVNVRLDLFVDPFERGWGAINLEGWRELAEDGCIIRVS
jgi:hypothetical protein